MTKLWFITGKGGVGKTHTSQILSRKNPGFHLIEEDEISRQVLAQDFLTRALKFKTIANLLGQSRLLQTLIGLAPNLHEILYMHELTRRSQTQKLLIDAPSTGNFIALFDALLTAQDLFETGLLRDLVEETLQTLRGPSTTRISIVSLPESSALSESEQIQNYIKSKWPSFEIDFVLNREHRRSTHPDFWKEPWKSLADKRIELDAQRIRGFEAKASPFSLRLFEGES